MSVEPIQFTYSLQGDYEDINLIQYIYDNGNILSYFPHGLITGNKVKVGSDPTIYCVRVIGTHLFNLHANAANASTEQTPLTSVGEIGDDIYILAVSSSAREIVDVANSLITAEKKHYFNTGDKVKFEVSTLNKDKSASVKIANPGDNFVKPPSLLISDPDEGASTDIKAMATVLLGANGSLRRVIMTHPGRGYVSDPTVTLQDLNFKVIEIEVTNGGSGYVTSPNIELTGGGGAGAQAVPVLDGVSGSWTIESITVLNGGEGYSSAPTIKITGGGVDKVGSLTLNSVGNNYSYAPTVSFVGGSPTTPAEATASITETITTTDYYGNPTTETVWRDYITSLTLTNAGAGYSQVPTVVFTEGGPGGGGATTTTTTDYPGGSGGGGGGSSGGATVHATATATLAGDNTIGTVATATASLSETTAAVEGKAEGTLGTLQNELIDEIDEDIVYYARKFNSHSFSVHRTKSDAENNLRALDFGLDNLYSQVAIVRLLNDPDSTTSSAPPTVSSTILSHMILEGSVAVPVENTNGFESGKEIIIDEDDCQEERATILTATSTYLVLTAGTQYAHEKGKPLRLVLPNE